MCFFGVFIGGAREKNVAIFSSFYELIHQFWPACKNWCDLEYVQDVKWGSMQKLLMINITNPVASLALAVDLLWFQVLDEAAAPSLWATAEPNESLCSHLTLAQALLDM